MPAVCPFPHFLVPFNYRCVCERQRNLCNVQRYFPWFCLCAFFASFNTRICSFWRNTIPASLFAWLYCSWLYCNCVAASGPSFFDLQCRQWLDQDDMFITIAGTPSLSFGMLRFLCRVRAWEARWLFLGLVGAGLVLSAFSSTTTSSGGAVEAGFGFFERVRVKVKPSASSSYSKQPLASRPPPTRPSNCKSHFKTLGTQCH